MSQAQPYMFQPNDNRKVLGEIHGDISKSSSCVNILLPKRFEKNVPTSWNYGSFNPSSNYFTHQNLHSSVEDEGGSNVRGRDYETREFRYSDPEFVKAINSAKESERNRFKNRIEDAVLISREGSQSLTRVIDVLKKIKSPKQIKVPKETENLIDKVIRHKMYPVQSQQSLSKHFSQNQLINSPHLSNTDMRNFGSTSVNKENIDANFQLKHSLKPKHLKTILMSPDKLSIMSSSMTNLQNVMDDAFNEITGKRISYEEW